MLLRAVRKLNLASEFHGRNQDEPEQRKLTADFKDTLLKELKVYVDWSMIGSEKKSKRILEKMAEKLESHFMRNPTMSSQDMKSVAHLLENMRTACCTQKLFLKVHN